MENTKKLTLELTQPKQGIFHNSSLRGFMTGVSLLNFFLSLYLLMCYIIFLVGKQNNVDEDCTCVQISVQPEASIGSESPGNEARNGKTPSFKDDIKLKKSCVGVVTYKALSKSKYTKDTSFKFVTGPEVCLTDTTNGLLGETENTKEDLFEGETTLKGSPIDGISSRLCKTRNAKDTPFEDDTRLKGCLFNALNRSLDEASSKEPSFDNGSKLSHNHIVNVQLCETKNTKQPLFEDVPIPKNSCIAVTKDLCTETEKGKWAVSKSEIETNLPIIQYIKPRQAAQITTQHAKPRQAVQETTTQHAKPRQAAQVTINAKPRQATRVTTQHTKPRQTVQVITTQQEKPRQATQVTTIQHVIPRQAVQVIATQQEKPRQATQVTTIQHAKPRQAVRVITSQQEKPRQATQVTTIQHTKPRQAVQVITTQQEKPRQATQVTTTQHAKPRQAVQVITSQQEKPRQVTQVTTTQQEKPCEDTQITTIQHAKPRQVVQVMHYELLAILTINIVRATLEQLLVFVGDFSDRSCNFLSHALVILNAITIHCCVIFLWLRQYVIYSNPLIKKFSPKGLKCINMAIYFEILGGTVVVYMSLYLWWRSYTTEDGLCRPLAISDEISPIVRYGPIILSIISAQISLTYLFIYPLVSYKKQMQRRDIATEDTKHSTEMLLGCLKRALAGATVGFAADLSGILALALLPHNIPSYFGHIIYEEILKLMS